ncbi:hypothetical protein [Mycobacteroides abscessus]
MNPYETNMVDQLFASADDTLNQMLVEMRELLMESSPELIRGSFTIGMADRAEAEGYNQQTSFGLLGAALIRLARQS